MKFFGATRLFQPCFFKFFRTASTVYRRPSVKSFFICRAESRGQVVAILNKSQSELSIDLGRLPVRGLGPMLSVFSKLTMVRLTELLLVSVKSSISRCVLPRWKTRRISFRTEYVV